jgi:WD40 repeat protein
MIARELETPSVKRSTSLEPSTTFGCPANWTAYGLFLVRCYSDPHQGIVLAVAFSPDGRMALTGSWDGAARLWAVPRPITGEPQRIELWAQVITGIELDELGVIRSLDAPTWQERRRLLQELGRPPMP